MSPPDAGPDVNPLTRYDRMSKPELIRALILTKAELHEAYLNINHYKQEVSKYHDLWVQELADNGGMEEGVAKEHSP